MAARTAAARTRHGGAHTDEDEERARVCAVRDLNKRRVDVSLTGGHALTRDLDAVTRECVDVLLGHAPEAQRVTAQRALGPLR
jgi:hypothetical protein